MTYKGWYAIKTQQTNQPNMSTDSYSYSYLWKPKKKTVYDMVFGVVTSDGHVMPPLIFPHLRLNMENCTKNFEEGVLPRIKRMATGRPYVW